MSRAVGKAARLAIAHVAARSSGAPLSNASRVTVHFHPASRYRGELLLDAMRRDGRYRSQFETGTTNGGTGTDPGQRRWSWESRLFGTAYDASPASERPIYGALDVDRQDHGAAPRFGSAFLRLTPDTLERCTFCYPDSVFEPTAFGVADRCDLLERAREQPPDDALDAYVEAHIHGPLRLAQDVEALVLDPSFRDSPVERAAQRWSCPVEWHSGFRLSSDELERYSPELIESAWPLVHRGELTPAVLADSAIDSPHQAKALWHCLARHGRNGR